jgi:hypothetical protein
MIENDHNLFYFCFEFYKEQYCGVKSKSERMYSTQLDLYLITT